MVITSVWLVSVWVLGSNKISFCSFYFGKFFFLKVLSVQHPLRELSLLPVHSSPVPSQNYNNSPSIINPLRSKLPPRVHFKRGFGSSVFPCSKRFSPLLLVVSSCTDSTTSETSPSTPPQWKKMEFIYAAEHPNGIKRTQKQQFFF